MVAMWSLNCGEVRAGETGEKAERPDERVIVASIRMLQQRP